jgi:hypothetical protein
MAKKRAKPRGDTWFDDYLEKHAFRGEIEFDLTFEMCDQRFTRRARIVYAHTPDWPFLDPKTHTEREKLLASTYHIELLVPPEDNPDNRLIGGRESHWIHVEALMPDGVLPTSVLNAIADAIDETCKKEDAKRRRAAGMEK